MAKNYYAQISQMLASKPQLLALGGFEGVFDEIYKYEEELLLENGTFASEDEISLFSNVDYLNQTGEWNDTTEQPSPEEVKRMSEDPRMEILREFHRMTPLMLDESMTVERFDKELEQHDKILSQYITMIPGQREFRFLQSEEHTKELLRELIADPENGLVPPDLVPGSDLHKQWLTELKSLGISTDAETKEGTVIPFDTKKFQ